MTTIDIDRLAVPANAVRLRRNLPIIVVICAGCLLSLAAFAFAGTAERQARQEAFQRIADDRIVEIQAKIETTLAILRSFKGLYAASQNVDRREFRSFVQSIEAGPVVQALEWIPRVPEADRERFESAAKQDGFSEFQFIERAGDGRMTRAAGRPDYFPVYYLEPFAGNEAALGFDLGSSSTRLEALNRARDTGEMVATARITLVQETGNQFGFLIFVPIYRDGAPTGTITERRNNLEGFGLGVFRIGDLIEAPAGNEISSRTFVRVFDESAPADSRSLYPKLSDPEDGTIEQSTLRVSQTVDVAGRDWLIEITPELCPKVGDGDFRRRVGLA